MAAGKHYVWAVDATSDGVSGARFGQLLAVVNGCVAPDPTDRLTVPQVLEMLMTLQRDLADATGVDPAVSGAVFMGGRATIIEEQN